ncbi:MAG: GMC oxidoreductase, partial [Alphaproteobacteria bacterium]
NKPQARGMVAARSADARAKPQIQFNYMDNEADRERFRQCLRLTREIIGQPAFDAYRDGEIQPGKDVRSDDEIDAWVAENAESAFHPSCTCKIGGADDALAVLDPKCRVRGVDGLRVVDSSVFPSIPNGNLNAATIMVAEKAADLIRGRDPLPLVEADVYLDAQWQTRQRPGKPLRVVEG